MSNRGLKPQHSKTHKLNYVHEKFGMGRDVLHSHFNHALILTVYFLALETLATIPAAAKVMINAVPP